MLREPETKNWADWRRQGPWHHQKTVHPAGLYHSHLVSIGSQKKRFLGAYQCVRPDS